MTGIRTWSIGNTDYLGTLFSNINLYVGTGGISIISSGNLTEESNVDSNPNIIHSTVTYPGTSLTYQGSSGANRTMWQHDFTNLDLKVDGGVKYYFAVDGVLRVPDSYWWFNHASNAILSGTPQQGADNKWLVWSRGALASSPNVCNSLGIITGVCDGGWDKSSDINVQVFAHKVVDICHLEKKSSNRFHLITVDANAVTAHERHGDKYPGDVINDFVLGADCSLIETKEHVSPLLQYGSWGWAGWSCPSGEKILSADVTGISIYQSALWKSGASLAGFTYPNTPFGYTYVSPEEGFIAQAGALGGTATIHLTCY